MEKFIIEGGNKLKGAVEISGAKNAVLPMMAASLLTSGISVISNVPYLRDIKTMSDVLRVIGAKITGRPHIIEIDTSSCDHLEAPYELVKTMRASIYVLGPLLAKYGRCRVSLPGGCAWGPRPVDFHIKGMQALGADVKIEHGYIEATAKKLKGADICFDISSVGATANIMMAATLAKGKTTIKNAAREPEIKAVADYLKKMGAHIEGAGTDTIKIEGVKELYPANMPAIPDRIEAGTFLVAAAACGDNVTISKCNLEHISSVVDKLRECGVNFKIKKNSITVYKTKKLNAINITTAIYPGFPTDMQAQFMALLSIANGSSMITDTIYTDRFTHVAELERLGAKIKLKENIAAIKGVSKLSGAHVMATDLRASAALVIAGLTAEGSTHLHRIYHIDRGYERIEEKLQKLGAKIKRTSDEMQY